MPCHSPQGALRPVSLRGILLRFNTRIYRIMNAAPVLAKPRGFQLEFTERFEQARLRFILVGAPDWKTRFTGILRSEEVEIEDWNPNLDCAQLACTDQTIVVAMFCDGVAKAPMTQCLHEDPRKLFVCRLIAAQRRLRRERQSTGPYAVRFRFFYSSRDGARLFEQFHLDPYDVECKTFTADLGTISAKLKAVRDKVLCN